MPAAREPRARPHPATWGSGSSTATTTRRDAGGDERVGARRCAAVVRARLEGAYSGRARGGVAGGAQRDDLGVGAAGRLGGSLVGRPSAATITQPTHGFGEVRVRAGGGGGDGSLHQPLVAS